MHHLRYFSRGFLAVGVILALGGCFAGIVGGAFYLAYLAFGQWGIPATLGIILIVPLSYVTGRYGAWWDD